MKYSKILGMKACHKEQKGCGYILGISCTRNSIEGYICCDERENELLVPMDGAVFSADKMTYAVCEKIKRYKTVALGTPVYGEDGEKLGKLSEIFFTQRGLTSVRVGGKSYPAERVVLGDAVIIKSVSPQNLFLDAVINRTLP